MSLKYPLLCLGQQSPVLNVGEVEWDLLLKMYNSNTVNIFITFIPVLVGVKNVLIYSDCNCCMSSYRAVSI